MVLNSISLPVYTVAIGSAGIALIGVWLSFSTRPFRRALASALLPLTAAGLAMGTWTIGQPLAVWATLLALAGATAALQVLRVPRVAGFAGRAVVFAGDPRWLWGFLLLACFLFMVWWYAGPHEGAQAEQSGSAEAAPGAAAPAPESINGLAKTDRGHPVQLRRVVGLDPSALKFPAAEVKRIELLKDDRLRTAAPDSRYNCHGWLFAAGRYWLDDAEVDTILKDNGYAPVSNPQENDLAIYRSSDGGIMHSGLVRTAAKDGLILVESKWGPLGRFIHRPDPLPIDFSACVTYFHSPRRGHLLRGLENLPETDGRAATTAERNPSR